MNSRKESATHPVHAIRISWTPAKNAAAYRVHCEANSTDEVVTIFDKEIVDEVTEVHERFVLPRGPLSVVCCVAAANKHGASLWTYSPIVTIRSLNNEAHSESIRGIDRWKSITSEDLTTDQLLELIHGSETMDLPAKPIIRPPEEPIIIRPKQPTYFSVYEKQRPFKSLNFDIDTGHLEQDYETVEREIRENIGAMDASKSEQHDSLQMSGFLNRVL
uniref:Fibronectin type-III domain-containing protein n=1 Tax=Angiostrongylus cantonensis TaxID=6313 RepID=A0A158P950_ANGCA